MCGFCSLKALHASLEDQNENGWVPVSSPRTERSPSHLFSKLSGTNSLHLCVGPNLQTPVVHAHSSPSPGESEGLMLLPFVVPWERLGAWGLTCSDAPQGQLGLPCCPLWGCHTVSCCTVIGAPFPPLLGNGRWSKCFSPFLGVQVEWSPDQAWLPIYGDPSWEFPPGSLNINISLLHCLGTLMA